MSLTPLFSVLHLSASLLFHHLFPQPSVQHSPSSSLPVPAPLSLCSCFILSGSQLAVPHPASRLGQAQDCMLLVELSGVGLGGQQECYVSAGKLKTEGSCSSVSPGNVSLPSCLKELLVGSGRGLLNQVRNTSCPACARRYFVVLKSSHFKVGPGARKFHSASLLTWDTWPQNPIWAKGKVKLKQLIFGHTCR